MSDSLHQMMRDLQARQIRIETKLVRALAALGLNHHGLPNDEVPPKTPNSDAKGPTDEHNSETPANS